MDIWSKCCIASISSSKGISLEDKKSDTFANVGIGKSCLLCAYNKCNITVCIKAVDVSIQWLSPFSPPFPVGSAIILAKLITSDISFKVPIRTSAIGFHLADKPSLENGSNLIILFFSAFFR